MSEEKIAYMARQDKNETPVSIAAKVAEVIEMASDINFDDGYKPANAIFKGLSVLWNKEDGCVVIEFENGQRFELSVKETVAVA